MRRELLCARASTDQLFELVRPDSLYERPIPERHRIIFYLGHLEAFDWNLVCIRTRAMAAFHPTFDRLFAFGIDPVEGRTPSDQPADWPHVGEVHAYNQRVREEVDRVFDELPEQIRHVAIEHRLMHAETLAYMLHNLGLEHKITQPPELAVAGQTPEHEMVAIPHGTATLGRAAGDGFGWDNEFRQNEVRVPAFAIGKYKVTNAEYLDFVREGANPPHFWNANSHGWVVRTMFGEIPLPLSWPVYVTHEQASQYAAWRGKRLPSEPEFHRAAFGTPAGNERSYPWGEQPPDRNVGNFDFAHWDPVPVTSTPATDSAFGVSQLVGNGWEWTSAVFQPFPGFEPSPFYAGYSANFFDGSHYVLKGGSPRTAGCMLRRSFRNWFRPQYPYVYAGFRCVEE